MSMVVPILAQKWLLVWVIHRPKDVLSLLDMAMILEMKVELKEAEE